MKTINVNLKERSYKIIIGSGAIKTLPSIIKEMKYAGPIAIITDTLVASKTKNIYSKIFKKIKNESFQILVPPTEKSKSFEVFQDVIQKISRKTKNHKPLIVALGGGVVGDLAGFVAASYKRGVPIIQIPTTLLAQVDSSIGGKVGIDLPEAKNLVGAFHQPKAVIIDFDFLKTLPLRQIRNGLGEIIKYSIIRDKGLFAYLDKNMKKLLKLDKNVLEKVVYTSALIKAEMVEKDERDVKDIRIILNFGHTLGHAIEAASEYSNAYNHGESVAVGMLLAGEIAKRLEMFSDKDFEKMKNLVKKAGLRTEIKNLSLKKILSSHEYDKKFTSGANRFVLPRKIGHVDIVESIPELLIKTVLRLYVRKT